MASAIGQLKIADNHLH